MIKLNTARFGELKVEEDKVITFPSGLVGLPNIHRFILIDHKDTPLKWLQSLDDPEIAFIVVSPTSLVADYRLDLDKSVRQYIQLVHDDDLAVLVTMRVRGEDVIANFQGPLLINSSSKIGVQVVVDSPSRASEKII